MKKLLWISLVLLWACNTTQKPVGTEGSTTENSVSVDPVEYARTITEEELKEHLYTYASDEFEGRETGKEGQKKAIAYLKAAYEELNIPAAQENGDYFQKVPLEMAKLPVGSINFSGKEYEIGKDFLAFNAGEGSYDEVVFVAYGIDNENYTDYANVDVKGKLVLMKFGEPQNADNTYVITGTKEASGWSNMSEAIGLRTEAAMAKGAKGIL